MIRTEKYDFDNFSEALDTLSFNLYLFRLINDNFLKEGFDEKYHDENMTAFDFIFNNLDSCKDYLNYIFSDLHDEYIEVNKKLEAALKW